MKYITINGTIYARKEISEEQYNIDKKNEISRSLFFVKKVRTKNGYIYYEYKSLHIGKFI